MLDDATFEEGTPIHIEIFEHGLKIKKLFRLPFTEAELFKDLTPEAAHRELLASTLDKSFLLSI